MTFLALFLTPFSVKIFSPNKVTISSPKMVSFLVSQKIGEYFGEGKGDFPSELLTVKVFLSEKMSVRELRIHL